MIHNVMANQRWCGVPDSVRANDADLSVSASPAPVISVAPEARMHPPMEKDRVVA
jgi:hypothetical protein